MRFLTIGLGHCGGKIANSFRGLAKTRRGVIVDICAINTDKADLLTHTNIPEKNKLCIGSGRGAAKDWNEGRRAAIEARRHMEELVKRLLAPDTDIILLTLGEGGGSGSGIAPIVAEIIGDLGRDCIAIVTLPFERESVKTKINAVRGLDLLYRQESLKALICIDNDKIVAHYPHKTLTEAYEAVNRVVVETFLNLVDLAHLPSRADRIDESELSTIFRYEGFATLSNYRARSDEVEDLSATLVDTWSSSLFADVDTKTAVGAIFGIEGPTRLFTTLQVDRVRRCFKDALIGRDVILGIYPIERSPWVSILGVLVGLDIPGKIRSLYELARREYQRHLEAVEERRMRKRRGLFELEELEVVEKRETVAPRPVKRAYAPDAMPIREKRSILEFVGGLSGRAFAEEEFRDLLREEFSLSDAELERILEELRYNGWIFEPRRGLIRVL
jgi:cell division GTPase FtsZ